MSRDGISEPTADGRIARRYPWVYVVPAGESDPLAHDRSRARSHAAPRAAASIALSVPARRPYSCPAPRVSDSSRKPEPTYDAPTPFGPYTLCPADARNFRSRRWHPALRRAGLRAIRIHDAGHTHASLFIAAGAGVVAVSRQLGHGNPAITLGVYSHAFQRRNELPPGEKPAAFMQRESVGCHSVAPGSEPEVGDREVVEKLVARGGIEPPTRGFSVAGTVALTAPKPKTRDSLISGVGPGRAGPNPCRTDSARLRRAAAYSHAARRVTHSATEL